MQKKKKLSINIYLLLLIVFSCDNKTKSEEFHFDLIQEKVERIIKIPDSAVLDLSKITPFDWDELFIFKPYTSIEEINKELGHSWSNAAQSLIYQEDTSNLLVFTKNKKVINYINWPRNKGDFIRIEPLKNPYSRKQATFSLKSEKFGKQNWLFLYSTINEEK